MKSFNYLYILFIIVTFSACKEEQTAREVAEAGDKNEVIVTKSQFGGGSMEMGNMEMRNFPVTVRASGLIDVPPGNRAVINAFMGGYIKNTPLLVGDVVRKGQPLVTIENPEFIALQQDYLDAAEQLKYLKSDYDRQQTMLDEKITSEKKFLQAESDYRRNLARYNGLKQSLQMLNINTASVEAGRITSQITIYAPISGSITQVKVHTGMYVSPTDMIMEIISMEQMHLELSIFEKDVMKIKKGQRILFRAPEAARDDFPAEVSLVGTSIDPQKRAVSVHGHLPDSIASGFSVGMFVEAEIETETREFPGLPEEAVITMDGFSYVLQLVKEENGNLIFQRKTVTPGSTYRGYTALENTEFSPTDQFLVRGSFSLIGE